MTRTIFLSGLLTVLLLAAGTVGYSLGQDDSADSVVACDAALLSKAVAYKGMASGPDIDGEAQAVLSIDANKGKVTGFLKGKRGDAKWNVGLSGTYDKKTKTLTATGSNKTNTLTLNASICGKQLQGTASGKLVDKDAWLLVNASK